MNKNYVLKEGEKFVTAARVVEVNKQCKCGKFWHRAPAHAVENEFGIWWDCHCRSTLCELNALLKAELKEKGIPA